MFLAAGSADVTGALFHLQTHAFFKSLLFMCAGIMIQACGEEHDIFRMGAHLRRRYPGLFALFTCGAAALAGIPFTSGYFSKGRTLADALTHPDPIFLVAFALGALAALITAIYVFRMYFVAFFAEPADPAPLHSDPALLKMQLPLWPLAVLAVCYGFVNPPEFLHLRAWLDHYLLGVTGPVPPAVEHAELFVEILDALLALAGLTIAWGLYRPARRPEPAPAGLLTAGLGLAALYLKRLAAPYARLAAFAWRGIDEDVLDGATAALASGIGGLSSAVARLGNGRIAASLLTLFAAAAALLLWVATGWSPS